MNLSYLQKQNIVNNSNWEVFKSFDINHNMFIMFTEKQDKSCFVNYSVYWMEVFGKYFLLKCQGVNSYSYVTLSLSPYYQTLK